MRKNRYNWTAHVNAAAITAAAVVADSGHDASVPVVALQLTHVAAATDADNPGTNHKGALKAAVSNDF